MNSALVAAAVALFVSALGCYAMRPAAHMAPIGDMLLAAAFAVGAAVAARARLADNPRLRLFAYAAIWLAIALSPWVVGFLRKDQSATMGMLTMWALLPAIFLLVRGWRSPQPAGRR